MERFQQSKTQNQFFKEPHVDEESGYFIAMSFSYWYFMGLYWKYIVHTENIHISNKLFSEMFVSF